ncbi:hypothetical protein EVAR_69389_1 [Eumeta japonica]|uniref:Uncharacterized protein n=1 Tax=Eumeta variegata TaxID=151549 RepID=A0A4C2A1D8_EUMVA|nr:hypothetical protein EVAR_69389_1 [Eumeta japonica]
MSRSFYLRRLCASSGAEGPEGRRKGLGGKRLCGREMFDSFNFPRSIGLNNFSLENIRTERRHYYEHG